MSLVTERARQIHFKVWEDSHHSSKTSLLLMELLPVFKENHFCNWSWRHHLVLTSICAQKYIWICSLTVRSKSRSGGCLRFGCITPRQRHSWPCYCNLPTSLLLSEGFVTDGRALRLTVWTLCFLCQVPEWTKCSSREKRKEKKVDKPFYSDSEGESGPTESADSGNLRVKSITDVFVCVWAWEFCWMPAWIRVVNFRET